MGNVLLDKNPKYNPLKNFQLWIKRNRHLSNQEILFENKVFKTCAYKYKSIQATNILIKVYIKRQLIRNAKQYKQSFQKYTKALDPFYYSNVLPFTTSLNIDNNEDYAVVIRQKLALTVKDRLLIEPQLSLTEKLWIITQTIIGLYILHNQANLYHGNIRPSNLGMTSYLEVFLIDFAQYKPLFLRQNELQLFRLFYTTSTGNECYLAPEKFLLKSNSLAQIIHFDKIKSKSSFSIKNLQDISGLQIQKLQNAQKMDIFSLAATIAHIFYNRSLLSYQQLMLLRKSQLNINQQISKFQQTLNFDILAKMLSLNPIQRPQIKEVLLKWINNVVNKQQSLLIWLIYALLKYPIFTNSDIQISLFKTILLDIQNYYNQTIEIKTPLPLDIEKVDIRYNIKICKQKYIKLNIIEIVQCPIINKILGFQQKFLQSRTSIQTPLNLSHLKQYKSQRQSIINKKFKQPAFKRLQKRCYFVYPKFNKRIQTIQEKLPLNIQTIEVLKQIIQDIKSNSQKPFFQKKIKISHQFWGKQSQIADILIQLIFRAIQNCLYIKSKMLGIQLIYYLVNYLPDRIIMKKLLPHIFNLWRDTSSVKLAIFAFKYFIKIINLVQIPFQNQEDAKLFKFIYQNCLNFAKSQQIGIVKGIIENLKQLISILYWLYIHQISILQNDITHPNLYQIPSLLCSKSITLQSKLLIMEAFPDIMKAKGILQKKKEQLLLAYFISLFNNYMKVSCIKNSIQIINQTLYICIEQSLDQIGLTCFYAIKYFLARPPSLKILKKIIPILLLPNYLLRMQAIKYYEYCLDYFSQVQIIQTLFQDLQCPFPLNKNQMDMLPEPFQEKNINFKNRQLMVKQQNNLVYTFRNYLKRFKGQKEQIQNSKVQINEWQQKMNPFLKNKKNQHNPQNLSKSIKIFIQSLYKNKVCAILLYMNDPTILNISKKNLKEQFQVNLELQQKNYIQNQKLMDQFSKLIMKNYKVNLNSIYLQYYQQQFLKALQNYLGIFHQQIKTFLVFYSCIKYYQDISLIYSLLIFFKLIDFQINCHLSELSKSSNQVQLLRIKIKLSIIQEFISLHFINIEIQLQNYKQSVIDFLYQVVMMVLAKYLILLKFNNITTDSIATIDYKQNNNQIRINGLTVLQDTCTIAVSVSNNIYLHNLNQLGKQQKKQDKYLKKYQTKSNNDIQQLIHFKGQMRNNIAYVTSNGTLGIQDIRCSQDLITFNIGYEKGIPKDIIFQDHNKTCIISTLNGYIIFYDIRCNMILSSFRLVTFEQNPLPITSMNIFDFDQKYLCLCYPSYNYQCVFFSFNQIKNNITPKIFFTTTKQQDYISTYPCLIEKDQTMKGLQSIFKTRIKYQYLQKASAQQIISYINDPLTKKINSLKNQWLLQTKSLYQRLSSIKQQPHFPFLLKYNQCFLTNYNPYPDMLSIADANFSIIPLQKNKIESYCQQIEVIKNFDNKIVLMKQKVSKSTYNCGCILNDYIILGGKDRQHIIKIFK